MINAETCKILECGKVIMDFATFRELANAKIESNKSQIEVNKLKMEINEYKWLIKELVSTIVKNTDTNKCEFFKENAMPIPLYPDIPEKNKADGECIIKQIGEQEDGE